MQELLIKYLEDKARKIGRRVNVSLLGYGSTNRAFIKALSNIECADVSVRQEGLRRGDIPESVRIFNGSDAFLGLYEDVLIPSPSVRREALALPPCAEYITDYDLLFHSLPEKLFCVSGSDGKSTVTSLASLLLYPKFPDLFTGGNIGTPLLSAGRESSAFLLELSSFTLSYSVPRCGRALLTNITPNHLDWHASFEEYKETKLSLIRGCHEPILNLSDKVSQEAARDMHAFCLVSDKLTHKEITGEYNTEHTVTRDTEWIMLNGERLIPITSIKRREGHNVENLALAIALSIGYTSREQIHEVAMSFEGLKERCEIFTKDGVDYVSSSIDTSPERTRTTLEGLGRRVNIILGGRTKRLPLEPLRDPLRRYAEKIAIYGEASDEFLDFINSNPDLTAIPHKVSPTLKGAIDYATEGIKQGDTVLLSPAATSYGEFTNYVQRGRFFKEYVTKNRPKI